jgi:hypothetical protein
MDLLQDAQAGGQAAGAGRCPLICPTLGMARGQRVPAAHTATKVVVALNLHVSKQTHGSAYGAGSAAALLPAVQRKAIPPTTMASVLLSRQCTGRPASQMVTTRTLCDGTDKHQLHLAWPHLYEVALVTRPHLLRVVQDEHMPV